MSERFRRFLNLEKPRRGPTSEPGAADQRRFGQVVAPPPVRTPTPTAVPTEATDRFRPPQEQPLDIVEQQAGAQPFIRCARCEMDNTVYGTTCQNCGIDLSTAEQRSFNEKLWSQRRDETIREQTAHAEREKEREQRATAEARDRRDLVEELARREGQRVLDELHQAQRPAWGDDPGAHTPWGVRMLGRIRNPRLRIVAAVMAVGLPVLFLFFGRRHSGLQWVGIVLLVVLAILFAPNYRYYRRRRWWWWD